MTTWTEDEINLIVQYYPNYGAKYCSDRLNKTRRVVELKAKKLGLTYLKAQPRNKILTKEFLQKEYVDNNKPTPVIAKIANCNYKTVCKALGRFNIPTRPVPQSNVKNILNQRFGRLIVTQFLGIKKHNATWRCSCDCGKIIETTGARLRNGKCKSCGCYGIEQSGKKTYKGGKYITGAEFSGCRAGARKRNFVFSISVQDVEDIYEKQNKKCALTGKDLLFNSRQKNNQKTIGNASIDRIDSSKGYTKDNIQIVDLYINLAKQDLTQEEFIKMCQLVVDYTKDI